MTKRILIVETSQSIAHFYKMHLQDLSLEVDICDSLNSCLLKLEDWTPNLILCSIELRDGNGVDLCAQLKRNPKTVLIPIIMMSSQDNPTTIKDAYAAGATDFISKSSNITFVVERLKSALFHHSTIPYDTRHPQPQCTILIAEDSPSQQQLYSEILSPMGYRLILCDDGESAWETLLDRRSEIDLILSDIEMPNINGAELCHLIRSNNMFDEIPIIVVSGSTHVSQLHLLLQQGVNDILLKPFCSEEFIARLRANLRNRLLFKEQQQLRQELETLNKNLEKQVRSRTQDIQEANISTIYKLAVACDYKDQDTALHINRVRHYVEELALASGVAPELAREFGYSSMMHDIGKIAIPDHILNKDGKLTPDEWQVMQTHTHKGADILGDKSFFKTARDIALFHHEKYDGSGYPHGLAGTAIPLAARLIAVVDVFDALTSARSYKHAWDIDTALNELNKLSGNHLDPALVETFTQLQTSGKLSYIRERYPVDQHLNAEMGMQLH
jgi:cyclic di-GMP phosphodiesterase